MTSALSGGEGKKFLTHLKKCLLELSECALLKKIIHLHGWQMDNYKWIIHMWIHLNVLFFSKQSVIILYVVKIMKKIREGGRNGAISHCAHFHETVSITRFYTL